jgi:hypothetical protein
MRAALVDTNGIVQNVIVVDELADFPGAVACHDWIEIGMHIDDPDPVVSPTAGENKKEAERRLAATDWVNQPDVYDPANTPHLLNRDDFLAYRAVVRGIAVNPSAGVLDWPVEPTDSWSQA